MSPPFLLSPWAFNNDHWVVLKFPTGLCQSTHHLPMNVAIAKPEMLSVMGSNFLEAEIMVVLYPMISGHFGKIWDTYGIIIWGNE